MGIRRYLETPSHPPFKLTCMSDRTPFDDPATVIRMLHGKLGFDEGGVQ
ncbi:unannotated protein [freshwater metagenome]|uniref:Unannotated protein n=1 Tax=freshwater metagenome TaxID=449393 RepID=A0A6J6SUZ8_9ZZZZ